jgi:hypothetical protein
MSTKKWLSGARLATVVGLVAGAAGIGVLRLEGVDMPVVPPGLVLLVGAALMVALAPWRWSPVVGALMGLAEVIGIIASGSVADLVDLSPVGVFIGTWIRTLGVVTALIAGVLATATNYRSSTSESRRATVDRSS